MRKNVILSNLLLIALLIPLSSASLWAQISATINNPGGCNATLSASVTGGTMPYTYSWDYGSYTLTGSSNTFAGYNGGFIRLYVLDVLGDTAYASLNLPQAFQLNVSSTPALCPSNNGSASVAPVGGIAPFTYLWSNGATTSSISGLPAGQYDVTVTDAAGCQWATPWNNGTVSINNNSPVTATSSATPSWCHNGTATVSPSGGTAPYNYYWYTNPVQTTQTAVGLDPMWANCIITDANGCTKSIGVSVGNSAGPFNITMSSTAEYCLQSNGTATCLATGGTPPYTYQWSTGATTSSIAGLSYGTYYMTLTDGAGCNQIRSVSVARQNPVVATATSVLPACGMNNGSASISVSGGNAPYTYTWSNGSTSPSVSGLAFGNYGWNVQDINGCRDYGYVAMPVPNNCLNTVSGEVYDDDNGNCIHDPGEFYTHSGIVQVGSSWAVADIFGNYSKGVYQTGTFSVAQPTPPTHHTQTCPAGAQNVTFAGYGSAQSGIDFANQVTAIVEDFRIQMIHGPARPGFNHWVKVIITNLGSTNNIIGFSMAHDPAFVFLNAATMPSNYILGTHTATWNTVSVAHGSSTTYTLNFLVPATVPINSVFSHSAFTFNTIADVNMLDNQASVSSIVTGAYDPNAKHVYQPTDLSPTDSVLTYTVHFQNTGNDTAFNVEILDTLDADLDISTLEILNTSHGSFNWGIEGSDVLRMTFPNIMLPDSNINEPRSHGHFSYKIQLKDGLPLPIHIENGAAIYFDFNVPIFTNTTHNQLGVDQRDPVASSKMQVFPNPSSGQVQVVLEGLPIELGELHLADLSGRILRTVRVESDGMRWQHAWDLSTLPAGMYLLQYTGVSGRISTHWVKI